MKKAAFIIFLSLISTSVFASGHGLEGLVYFFVGLFIIFFLIPLIIVTVLSAKYYFKPNATLLRVCFVLLILFSIADIGFFVYCRDMADSGRGGAMYILGMGFFIVVVAINLTLLHFGYYKHQRILNSTEEEISDSDSDEKRNYRNDLLLAGLLTFWLGVELINFIIEKVNPRWYETSTKYFMIGTNILFAFIPLAVSLAVRNTTLKIYGLILSSIVTLLLLYQSIGWLLREIN